MMWRIWACFFKVGMLGFGGGPSSIPLMQREVVGRYGWMTEDEFAEVLAIGNALPGPILTKMAGYIGYRLKGLAGLLNAIAATVLPTAVAMLLLFRFFDALRDNPNVAMVIGVIQPVVGVMLGVLAWEFLRNGWGKLGGWRMCAVLLLSLVLLEGLGLHPALLIAGLLVIGAFSGGLKPKGARV